jgi:hypothetical protein
MTQRVLLPPDRCRATTAEVTGVSIRTIAMNDGFGSTRFAHLADQSDHFW